MRRTPLGDPRVCHVYYGAIGTLGEGLCAPCAAPLGDPRICHIYYGAIGTLGEGLCARRTPLGDPWVCHVYYGAIGTLREGYARAVHHWVTHGYAMYTTVL